MGPIRRNWQAQMAKMLKEADAETLALSDGLRAAGCAAGQELIHVVPGQGFVSCFGNTLNGALQGPVQEQGFAAAVFGVLLEANCAVRHTDKAGMSFDVQEIGSFA